MQEQDAETAPVPGAERNYAYDLDLPEISELWRRGSVVASWLLDLTAAALVESPELSEFTGRVSDSGEGRWTLDAAIDEAVPAYTLSAASSAASVHAIRPTTPTSCCRRCASSSVVIAKSRRRRRLSHRIAKAGSNLHLVTVATPGDVERSLAIDPPIGVRAEQVAQSLDQARRSAGSPVAVVIGE